jgi:hypothetical protein
MALSNNQERSQTLPTIPASKRSGLQGDTVITTFNVENLFDLVHTPAKNASGTAGAATPEALATRLTKLALAVQMELALPQIIVVQEVETTALLQELGNRVNAAAGTRYTATSFETSDERGLEVGFLWDAQRVMLHHAFQLTDTLVPGVSAAFGRSSPSPGREPIVGVFAIKGRRLTIVGNHFKSARGDELPSDVSAPPMPRSGIQRKAQARVVRRFVNSLLQTNPDALLMVAGDLNDVPGGQPGEGPDHPLAILEGGPGEVPLTNLSMRLREVEPYTFMSLDARRQLLDHILVSPALLRRFVAVDILHFNAAFPPELYYDSTTTLRASDHDPVEAHFNLQ